MWDEYNNLELYEYSYNIDAESVHVDFNIFSSINLLDGNSKRVNEGGLDGGLKYGIDSPSETLVAASPESIDYILSLRDIPDDLSLYYSKYITEKMGDITETISLKYIDTWLEIISVPCIEGYDLYLKIYDVVKGIYTYIHYLEFSKIREYYGELLDCIYITKNDFIDSDIVKNEHSKKEYMIFSTETGISFDINLFDFVLLKDDDLRRDRAIG
ncbi:MAG: hypothetical protein EZS28_028999, partial [Streblomastix strix]